MARDLCTVVLTGRLTKDPELKTLPSGTTVCTMRVAYSTSRKDASGGWEDKSNYVDVTVFGRQAETCAQYLNRGKQLGVHGRLEWREWEKDGVKRQAYEIVADQVLFLGGAPEAGAREGTGAQQDSGGGGGYEPDAAPAASYGDDDIPF